ncbi:MAG TPA: S4 domain-containing protein [Candidatus Acidoferrales bacterium]|nr:S4 domain-containing protein [Candidatus Acidoferrales bacterium]
MEERLQKIIARAGIASRRHAEQLILTGQVVVNGRVVTELGTKADIERDHIRVGGKLLRAQERKVYIALHKPDGVVATMSDPEGRTTLADFVHGVHGRVFPVGRLEYHASGLVLLTNDGELANRMMRAHGLSQVFACKISGGLTDAEIRVSERQCGVKMRRAKGLPAGWWEVTMMDASRDAFRQALLASGHPVDKMRRMAIGNLELGRLSPGEYRHLTTEEVSGLEHALARAERGVSSIAAATGAERMSSGSRKTRKRPHSLKSKQKFPRR